ncbi:UDP-N-acetylmuramoyl-L-alanine--D-glutamate ligase [Actinokineospora sp. UTMC 2448]|uniref:UDP-N-acetylmuramoyl-L-alanine--D-glutamate ligase n=1 Tax=Actinokineospora sp. UTMC 2448 TaxID=2268449 RepID=UPI00216439E0|nr:UDP-N-acetylmuramoyl-L-alanine--D-glutamate ligase [Actinokineospora sp. UTMC 2448]UVS80949.1 UDP-N-acetylmuramoylalanine--D-glutamate ligase [Actinokineospora sp. UTMC 2448]
MTLYAGTRVLVAGAGVAGTGVARALVSLGAEVTVADGDAARLAALELDVRTAHAITEPPAGTELVVTSPGWRPDSPLLANAAVEVIGDVELAWRIGETMPEPPVWLAITGTNGKTTTVGMLESILLAAGLDAVACGNVGLPVVDAVLAGHRVLAVELSSFQLHWQSSMRAHAAAILNIAEDHIDWHGSLEEYARAKARVYTGARYAVHNTADELVTRLAHEVETQRVGFGLDTPRPGGLGVVEDLLVDRAFTDDPVNEAAELATLADVRPPGPHNVANALAAAALARAYGVGPDAVRDGLRAFTPGRHRAEVVAEAGGLTYVNDSKATNPHAAGGSLRAFDSIVWIAGGLLKGATVDDLAREVSGRLRGVVVMGADGEVIAGSVARHAPDVPVERVPSGDDEPMIAAVRAARALARPGDVVLLAPAAASLDMFRDYAHRGEAFVEAVRRLTGEDHGGTGAR